MSTLHRLAELLFHGTVRRSAFLAFSLLGWLTFAVSSADGASGFVSNGGQVDSRVRYYVPLGSVTAFFTSDGIVFDLRASRSEQGVRPSREAGFSPMERGKVSGHAVALKFLDRSDALSFVPSNELDTKFHYFRGSNSPSEDAQDGASAASPVATTIAVYDELTMRDVWPGIDLVFSTDGRSLTYQTRMRDQANGAEIRMEWEGTTDDAAARLGRIETTAGVLTHSHTAEGGSIAIAATENESEVDPVTERAGGSLLKFGTYLGWAGDDLQLGTSIALDTDGNVIVTGYTSSSYFPVTPGAYDRVMDGRSDVFISKLSADGDRLLWSTFLGGSGGVYAEVAHSVVVDDQDRPIVVGYTDSANFPTTVGACDRTYHGGVDAFVAKLSANGSALIFSTFLGGVDHDMPFSVVLDDDANPIVGGWTRSPSFPTTPGAYDQTPNGGYDCVVFKLRNDGQALLWSTLAGGSLDDGLGGVVLDSEGRVNIVGYTESPDFPTTVGSHDQSWNGGPSDAFASKLTSDGAALMWSTYLGGSGTDSGFVYYGSTPALDSSDNLVMVGHTTSTDFPTTDLAYDDSMDGSSDAFVTKISGADGSLLWSTFLGGSLGAQEGASGVDLDELDRPVVFGYTDAPDFPTVPGSYDTSHNGELDAFICRLSSDGGSLITSTFLGGSDYDLPWFATVESGSVFVTGETTSLDFPTTRGAFQEDAGGEFLSQPTAWVARMTFPSDPASAPLPASSEAGLSLSVSPNPGVGAVHFSLLHAVSGALTIVDPTGRVVTRTFLADADRFEWNGMNDRGQASPAGMYLAIVDSEAYRATTRFLLIR